MGHDIHPIGNHQLKTTSPEALAKDLSIRFKANVEYGYYDTFDFDLNGNEREPSYDYIVHGKINHPEAKKTLWLSDEFCQIHKIIKKFGNDAYKLPLFHNNYKRQEIDEALNSICFELRDNCNNEDYGIIYNDTFHDFYNNFDLRWWNFCKAFTANDKQLLDHINLFRLKMMNFFQTIGGNNVVYLDDQGKTQYLTEEYYNWNTILAELNNKFKKNTLHISDFITQKKVWHPDKYPLAFYDDFADLKVDMNLTHPAPPIGLS